MLCLIPVEKTAAGVSVKQETEKLGTKGPEKGTQGFVLASCFFLVSCHNAICFVSPDAGVLAVIVWCITLVVLCLFCC